MYFKKTSLSIYSAAAILLFGAMQIFSQNDAYNKIEVFGGYSLAMTRTNTESASFRNPGGVETFNNFCSSQTGDMIGKNFQKFFCDRRGFSGFDTSVTYNIAKHVGIKADVTGHFKSDIFVDKFTPPGVTQTLTTQERLYNFLAGIQIKNNSKSARFKPFGHVLAGVARYSNREKQTYDLFPQGNFDARDSFKSFAMKFGGGIDIRAGSRVDIRLFEIDYNPIVAKNREWEEFSGPFTISSVGKRSDNITFSFGIVIH